MNYAIMANLGFGIPEIKFFLILGTSGIESGMPGISYLKATFDCYWGFESKSIDKKLNNKNRNRHFARNLRSELERLIVLKPELIF